MQRQQVDAEADRAVDDSAAASPEAALEAGDLRSVERLLAGLQKAPADPFILPRREPAQRPEPTTGALQTWALQPLPNHPTAESRGGFLAWLFLSLGLMAFACGGVMLVWSVLESREELWSLGIPLALGGQGAIIFGLIGLAEAAAQRQKQFVAALEEHRQRLVLMQNLALAGQQTPSPARRAA
jgi:hypothetical protein